MAVKRRVIWLSDEEWALLRAHAKDHGETVSGVIRDMWKLAAQTAPATPAQTERIVTNSVQFHPVPKPSQRKK